LTNTSGTSEFYSNTVTATSDVPFRIEQSPEVVLSSINIHCYTNDAYYGNSKETLAVIKANAVVWFEAPQGVKVCDLLFKNYTAGNNCTITVVGIKKR
jgi:hypothetical protein